MKKTSIEIIKKLRKAGFEAYWAGGCVRDILLGVEPKDFDIVTSAKPDQISKILKKTIGIGKQFGVITAHEKGHLFEIATFRGESNYSDRRRPDKVFWTNAKEDATRRDFTINGMFYDPIRREVIDYINGKDDIKNKIIRFIGNANDRIQEDHLRILRAIRFKNSLDFNYESRTWQAITNNSYLIQDVTCERIRDEINKMLIGKNRYSAISDLDKSDILQYILPEINRLKNVPQPDQFHKEGDVFTHTLCAVKSLEKNTPLYIVWATLLHDIGKPATISFPKNKTDRIRFNKHVKYSAGLASIILRRLKFPNYERKIIVWLIKNHMIIGDIPKMKLSKQRTWLMHPWFASLLVLHRADALGSEPQDLSLYKKNLSLYDDAKRLHENEMKRPAFKMLLNGQDLIENFGLSTGPKIGKLLQKLKEAQLNEEVKTKDQAISFINNQLKK